MRLSGTIFQNPIRQCPTFLRSIAILTPRLAYKYTSSLHHSLCSSSIYSSSYLEPACCLLQSMSGTEPEMAPRPQVSSRASWAFLRLMTRWYWKGRMMAM